MDKIILFRKHTAPASLSSAALPKTEGYSTPSASNPLLIPEGKALPVASRLVVLVPEAEMDEMKFAQTIWALATPRQLPVLFLGRCGEPVNEFVARRRLTNLRTMTHDHYVTVETRLSSRRDWIQAVREVWHPNDLVICHAEQYVLCWGLRRQALGRALTSALQAPVCVLSGLYLNLSPNRPPRTRHLVSLVMSLITLAAFFGIQAWVHQQTNGWVSTTLLVSLVLIEFGLIWFWNIYLDQTS